MTLQIKQDFDYQGNGKWLWSLGVYGPDEELEKIEFVRYTLLPIFSQPTIKSMDRKANFRIFEEAYEPFRIYVKIGYLDGNEENMVHDLTLAKISIKSDYQCREQDIFDWRLWIEGDSEELAEIESVSYQWLKQEKTTSDRASGFRIEDEGSGTIPITVDVLFRDRRRFPAIIKTLQLAARQEISESTREAFFGQARTLEAIIDQARTLPAPTPAAGSDSSADAAAPAQESDTGLPSTVAPSSADGTSTDANGVNQAVTTPTPLADVSTPPTIPPPDVSPPAAGATVVDIPTPPQPPKPFLAAIVERGYQALGGSGHPAPPAETVLDIKRYIDNQLFSSSIEELKQYFATLKERGYQALGGSEHPVAPAETVLDIQRLIDNQLFPSSIEVIKQYVGTLKGDLAYGLARKLLTVALQIPEWQEHSIWTRQQLAHCTYKDEEIPPKTRYEQALSILEEIGLRQPDNKNSETLALGGAIYKRKWHTSGQLEYLHESLFFYQAAYERNPEQDMGYGGVNSALIMDLLADRLKTIAARSGSQLAESERLQRLAKELRRRIATEIPLLAAKSNATAQASDYWDKQYWYLVTLAEVNFGLGNYEEARNWLAKASKINSREWEKKTLFKQLLQIGRLHGIPYPLQTDDPSTWHPAWQALTEILGENTGRALTGGRGKVGLALSGSGFRASFFHLGVLARLAEIDALRGVEVLSTVSGGSILGAHYYLEVQNLLQTKSDTEITREDYIEIVRRVQKDFLQGVQRNIRMRAFTNLRDNLRMFFSKTYTRSHRLGELYESELYLRVQDGQVEDSPRIMRELLIKPKNEPNPDAFKPKFSNWRRRAKAPVLLLNSTSLNSGHNWQFTASSMGEPPGLVGGEIDVNQRYRRVRYLQTPNAELRNYRLGHAVAASACVPGLFDPLSISGLFDERTVRLVDGGVHDNQGVAGLLDEGCTLILCSDACGQMADLGNPTDDPAGVLIRASSILQDRVREAEYLDLRSRLDSRALNGLFFVHTKKELESTPLDWINCEDPLPSGLPQDNRTSYGIDRDLQKKIAAIRTDLDAFTEVEAFALMASGYRMAMGEFKALQQQHLKTGQPGTWGSYDIEAPGEPWPFSSLEPLLELAPGANRQRNDLGLQLKVANKALFKAWGLMPLIEFIAAILVLIILLVDVTGLLLSAPAITMTWGKLLIGVIVLATALVAPALKWLFPKEEARGILLKATISLTGYMLSKVQLKLIDPLFLARGKLSRLLNL